MLIIIVVIMGIFTLAAFSNNFLQYNPLEQFTLFRVFSAFLVGCALFNIHEKMTVHKAFDVLAMITTLIIIAVCILPLSSIYDGLVVICFAFLILFLSKAQGIYERLVSTQLMMFLGRVSYSVYLIHATFLMVVNQVMSRLMDNSEASLFYLISFYFVYISASLIAGTMFFKLVENPARHYLRKNWLSTPATKSDSNASSSSIELNQKKLGLTGRHQLLDPMVSLQSLLRCQCAITSKSMNIVIFGLFEPTTEYLRSQPSALNS